LPGPPSPLSGSRLDRAAIAKIERNLRYVADYELVAMARALRVSPVRLLGRVSMRRTV
jgi:hypothetical protein